MRKFARSIGSEGKRYEQQERTVSVGFRAGSQLLYTISVVCTLRPTRGQHEGYRSEA